MGQRVRDDSRCAGRRLAHGPDSYASLTPPGARRHQFSWTRFHTRKERSVREYGSKVLDEPRTQGRAKPETHKQKEYVSALLADVKAKNPAEPEFHQIGRA